MKKETKKDKAVDPKVAQCIELGLKAMSGMSALDMKLHDIAIEMDKLIKGSPLIWRQVKTGIQIARGWEKMSDAEKVKLNNKLDYFRKVHLHVKARKCERSKVIPPAGNESKAETGKNDNPDKVVIPDAGKTQKSRLQVMRQVINALQKQFNCNLEELQELLAQAFAEIEDSAQKKVA